MTEIIIRNSVRCDDCGDEIESTHRHDFRRCSCGAVAVDGGTMWLRRAWREGAKWTETSIVEKKLIDVADLSQAELDKVADSEIPEDLRWNSDDEPAPALIVRGPDGYEYIAGTTHAVDFIVADIVIGLSLDQLAAQYPDLPAGGIEAVMRWNFERSGDDLSTTHAGRELAEKDLDAEKP